MESLTVAHLSDQFDAPLGTAERPSWRGRLHVIGLAAAVPAFALLLAVANGARARVGVVIYAAGLCSMFVTSATYHRWVHTIRARQRWRRADHAMIFAAIAGSFTPMCLLTVPDRFGIPLLLLVWVGGIAGMAMKIAGWRHQRIAGGIMYIALGWVGAFAIPEVWRSAGVWPAVLVLIGGVCYTVGAVWLLRKWPKLRPHVFSYHEVWHVWTVVAAAAHFAAVWMIVE